MLSEALRPYLRTAAVGAMSLSAAMLLSSCGIAQTFVDQTLNRGEPAPSEETEGTGSREAPAEGTPPEQDSPEQPPPAEENTDVGAIAEGDCLNDDGVASGEQQFSEVPVVDCSESHDSEVIAVDELESGRAFPGQDAIQTEADDLCTGQAFESYIGVEWIDSIYYVRAYPPVEEGWESGDYEVICAAYDQAGDMTGSIANSME